jgi:uncharacterized protein with HEPN domain
MQLEDRERLVDILESSREAVGYAAHLSGAELEEDRMRLLAIVRLLEVIGESANSVSENFQRDHPGLPWQQMIATRNRLIHGYRDIDPDIVASIARTNLPTVIAALELILA